MYAYNLIQNCSYKQDFRIYNVEDIAFKTMENEVWNLAKSSPTWIF